MRERHLEQGFIDYTVTLTEKLLSCCLRQRMRMMIVRMWALHQAHLMIEIWFLLFLLTLLYLRLLLFLNCIRQC
jgi:hypothetical protein